MTRLKMKNLENCLNRIKPLLEEAVALKEVYSKTDMKPVETVLKNFLKLFRHQLSPQDYKNIENQYSIKIDIFEEAHKADLIYKALYNQDTGITTLYLYSNATYRLYQDWSLKEQLLEEAYSLFVHEDTHKQQNTKSSVRIKAPLPEKDPFGHANHYKEVDAYARQCGYLLRKTYPDLSVNEIMKKVSKGKAPEKALDKISVYKNPDFVNAESKRFFHTLYQYLNSEETSLNN